MFNPNKIAQRLRCLHAQPLFTPEFLACFARALSHDCSQSRVVKQTSESDPQESVRCQTAAKLGSCMRAFNNGLMLFFETTS